MHDGRAATSSRPTRARAARCRSSRRRPASTWSPPRRASRSGEKLRDMPYGTGLAPAHAVRRRQSSRLLVFEDARRRDDPRPRDEVDRRGARHRRYLCRRAAQGVHRGRIRVPEPPAVRAAGASSSRSADEEKAEVGRAAAPLRRRWATRSSRPTARAQCWRRPASQRTRQQDRGGLAARARPDRGARGRSGHQRRDGAARIHRQLPDSARRGRGERRVLYQLDTARALASALESTAGPPRPLQEYLARLPAAAAR